MKLIALLNRLDLTYWAIRLLGRLFQRLPLPIGYALAAGAGDVVFLVWRSLRARTTENMDWVLGHPPNPRAARRLAAAAFRNHLRYLVDFLRFPAMTDDDMARTVEVRGIEHLHEAMAKGRGAIAVGFHIGNIDLGAAMLARTGYTVHVVVDRFEPPRLDRLIQRHREDKGLKLIPIDLAPRRAMRVLRSGEILALLMDKPTPGQGVVVRFFGGQLAIPAGAAFLALRTGAPVVPCCVVRQGTGRFLAEVAAAVDPRDLATGDKAADVQIVTQRLVDVLEGWVRRYPDQWYPFRKMFLAKAC